MNYVLILVGSILVNNFVMNKFMGICPFLGVSKKVETAFGMGMAVTFVMGVASLVTYFVRLLLVHFGIEYMQTIAFILVIAVLVQVVELVLRKISFALYQALGVYLPLITTNCAVLGVTILNVDEGYNLLESVVNGVGGALGFTLAIVLFAGIRERMALSDMPKWMNGFPGALITAGVVYLLSRVMPSEPENIILDPVYACGVAGGIVGYVLGRSRRGAFISGVMGVLLADLITAIVVWAGGVSQPLTLGGAGIFDTAVISGIIAVLLAEIIGETLERAARANGVAPNPARVHMPRKERDK